MQFLEVKLLKEQRIVKIRQMLERDGEVEINELCKLFNVTDMTIRRDLDNLAEISNIIRTHGGAMMAQGDQITEPSYDRRNLVHAENKEKIARKAIELITPGMKLFIDSGTTTHCLARAIPGSCRNVIITNDLDVAYEVIKRDYSSAIMIGGDLRKNTHSTRGALAEEQMKKFKVDAAFLGGNAIDMDGYVYVGSTWETGLKKCAIENASKTYILLDSSKFNQNNLISYINASDVAGIITDDEISEEIANKLRQKKVNLIIAS